MTLNPPTQPGGFFIMGINLKFIALAGGMQLVTVASVVHPPKGAKQ
jgi:hypothetical protein